MTSALQLKSFVDDELARSGDLILHTSSRVREQLGQRRDEGLLSPGERLHRLDLAKTFPHHLAPFRQRFTDSLREAGLVKIVDAHVPSQQAVDAMLRKLAPP